MANIYTSADQLIGKTPLLELTGMEREHKLAAFKRTFCHHRTNLRQHRDWSGLRRRSAGLPHYHCYARDHERRTAAAYEGLRRRIGPHRGGKGYGRRNRQSK